MKYTREKVLGERKCGLALLDFILKYHTIDSIIEKTIETYNRFPNIWGEGWPTVHWAMANAIIELPSTIKEKTKENHGMFCANLDEFLTAQQIKYIAEKCNITSPYVVSWQRGFKLKKFDK